VSPSLADQGAFWHLINDAWQSPVNMSGIQPPGLNGLLRQRIGGAMTIISVVSVPEIAAADQSLKIIALFSCIGLVASLGLMTAGIDLSAAWI
jgi:hypothetical protein